jgi:hypothetical protein
MSTTSLGRCCKGTLADTGPESQAGHASRSAGRLDYLETGISSKKMYNKFAHASNDHKGEVAKSYSQGTFEIRERKTLFTSLKTPPFKLT